MPSADADTDRSPPGTLVMPDVACRQLRRRLTVSDLKIESKAHGETVSRYRHREILAHAEEGERLDQRSTR